jgi:hypothetical protein
MKLTKTQDIFGVSAFVFGKPGSGYVEHAVEEAAASGVTLVVAYGAVDVLTGTSIVSGKKMPEVDVIDMQGADSLDELFAHLNGIEAPYESIVFYGLSQFVQALAFKIAGGSQPTQPQFGALAIQTLNYLRLLKNYTTNFYVTCDVREEEEGSGENVRKVRRFNTTPAITNTLSDELAQAWYVAALGTGERTVQKDAAMALAYRAEKPQPKKNKETNKDG